MTLQRLRVALLVCLLPGVALAQQSGDEACVAVLNERIDKCLALAQIASDDSSVVEGKAKEASDAHAKANAALANARLALEQAVASVVAATQQAESIPSAANSQALTLALGLRETKEQAVTQAEAAEATAMATLATAQADADSATAEIDAAKAMSESLHCDGFYLGVDDQSAAFLRHHQEGDDPACSHLASYLESRGAESPEPSADVEKRLQEAGKRVAQPARRTETNKSGTVAQVEPVATTRPINLAGGAVSVVGAQVGTQGAATVTINPWALGNPDSVEAQRLMDVSVTVPFSLTDMENNDVEFVAVRVRANITAFTNTKELKKELKAYAEAAGKFADSLRDILRTSPDVKACFVAVEETQVVSAEKCGSDLDRAHLDAVRATSYQKLAKVRREADRYHLGLDLRFDAGDPTGSELIGDDGTRLVGAIAGGLRIDSGETWNWALNARAGLDYFDSNEFTATGAEVERAFSCDWGAGIVLSGQPAVGIDKQNLGFGFGVEGRTGGSEDDGQPTNFVDVRFMVVVPTANGSDLALAAQMPVVKGTVDRGFVVSVSGDFGLLSNGAEPL
jgi:hypothetical protein